MKRTYKMRKGDNDVWVQTSDGIEITIRAQTEYADKTRGAVVTISKAGAVEMDSATISHIIRIKRRNK